MRGSTLGFHGLDMDEVGVVVVEDEQVVVAVGAGDDEATGLVSKDFAGSGEGGGVAEMGSFAVGERGWEQDLVDDVFVTENWDRGAGRLLVLADLVEVAFFHGD
jgi:hypothetical protein